MSRSAIDRRARAPSTPGRGGTSAAPRRRLGEGDPGVLGDPDDLSGRLHARPDGRVDATQLGGGERRASTATNGGWRQDAAGPAELRERRTERDPDREIDHRDAGDFREERHGPRRPWIDLDEVDAVVADDELGVAQLAHPELQDDALHGRNDQRLVALADCLRREHPDRVAGVDAGPLDVLEQAGDEDPLPSDTVVSTSTSTPSR